MHAALTAYSRVLDLIARVALWSGSVGLVVMTAAVAWQVWGRFVLNDTPSWTEPLSLFLMLWFILLVAAVGVRERFHLGLDLIRHFAPPRLNWAMDIAVFVVVGLFGAAMATNGWELTVGTWSARNEALHLPEGASYLSLVVSGLMITLFSIEHLVTLWLTRPENATVTGNIGTSQAEAPRAVAGHAADTPRPGR